MAEKLAGALPFVSAQRKVGKQQYEVFAKKASDAYVNEGLEPSAAIAAIAQRRTLNAEQIHRVVELTNHQINATLSKSASDQLFRFPVATVEGVMNHMDTTKTAGLEDDPLDHGVYNRLDSIPDYVDVLRSRRFDSSIANMSQQPKTAEVPADRGADVDRMRLLSGFAHTEALANVEYADLVARQKLAAVGRTLEGLETDEDRTGFWYAAHAVLGGDHIATLAKVYGKTAADFLDTVDFNGVEKVAEFLDTEHPVVQQIAELKTALEADSDAQQKLATVVDTMRNIGSTAKNIGRAAVKGFGNQVVRPAKYFVKHGKPGQNLANVVTNPLGTVGGVLGTGALLGTTGAHLIGARKSTGASLGARLATGFIPRTGSSVLNRMIAVSPQFGKGVRKSTQEAT